MSSWKRPLGLTEANPEEFEAAILFQDEDFREPLRGAVAAAGGVVSTELRIADVEAGLEIGEPVLIVNLEPSLFRKKELFDSLLEYRGQLIFNDAEASARLIGPARARWARHLAAKINKSDDVYPAKPSGPIPLERLDTEAVGEDTADVELWVFAASIGGPEAMRAFLGELKPDLPFCMVLVQHIGQEFIELMSQQLDQSAKMPVRIAIDGEAFKPGRVYVVPPGKAFQVTRENRVRLTRLMTESSYSPNIDQVISDAIERFGASTNVIIFSGMASDAIAGAATVMERGGEVWVQDPETCVVSSMVDGALKQGGVKFQAEPMQLAHRLNQRGIEQH
ncbi:MAG: chemotaxis protein CheB [Xanthomonadales bacterium]|nr:chemotaxis protein CheB [Xanthomonadales bacterium]